MKPTEQASAPRWETGVAALLLTVAFWSAAPTGAAAQAKKPAEKPKPAATPKPKSPAPKPAAKTDPKPAQADGKPEPKKAESKPEPKKAAAAEPRKGGQGEPKKPSKPDPAIVFFRDGVVPRLKIQIADGELNQLRQKNREYVRCTIVENDSATYEHVAIKLKGAAGSFRGVDDRPALTLNFDKFKDGQEFHGLDKLHLNNSVQDPSYLNELLSSELFLAAGVPAARTTHARVWINGRDLGLYVLKEGFGKDFLKRNGLDPKGNLYEGGFVQEIDGNVELDSGEGPTDRGDVKAVIAACREGDTAKRWARLEELVDIDRFLSFMAMEGMTCHWDGYIRARNNYRFYFDPKSGKVQFFPHGMDQMFADPNYNLDGAGSMVAQAVMSNPEWKARYRDRVAELVKLFDPPDRLQKRVDEIVARLRPVLTEMGGNWVNQIDGQSKGLKDRLAARARSLAQQAAVVEPRPLRFAANGVASLTNWAPQVETPDAKAEKQEGGGGKPAGGVLLVTAGPSGRCVASWRTKVLLPAGKYRFEGRVRTEGVKALQEGSGAGAGIRVSGGSRTNKLEGTAGWTTLTHEIQVGAPTQEVVLVAELRATAGQAHFDLSSLRLVKAAQ